MRETLQLYESLEDAMLEDPQLKEDSRTKLISKVVALTASIVQCRNLVRGLLEKDERRAEVWIGLHERAKALMTQLRDEILCGPDVTAHPTLMVAISVGAEDGSTLPLMAYSEVMWKEMEDLKSQVFARGRALAEEREEPESSCTLDEAS